MGEPCQDAADKREDEQGARHPPCLRSNRFQATGISCRQECSVCFDGCPEATKGDEGVEEARIQSAHQIDEEGEDAQQDSAWKAGVLASYDGEERENKQRAYKVRPHEEQTWEDRLPEEVGAGQGELVDQG